MTSSITIDNTTNNSNNSNNKNENEDDIHYIYLIKPREFVRINEDIYKIGKSRQKNLKRITNYPNGTILLYQSRCINCDTMEKKLINIFKRNFIHRSDIGFEYFEGDCEK